MKVIIAIVTILVLAAIFYFSAGAYIAFKLTIPTESPVEFERNDIGRGTDVVFRSSDNLQLAGWYFPGTNGKAILFVHGAGDQNRVNDVYGAPDIARYFLNEGYTILMFDLRGTGESTQTRISFGQYEQNDVRGAYEYLKTQDFPPQSIGIISDSLGAIATAMAADGIRDAGGIVLDSPASEVKSVTSHILESEHSIPRFLHPGIYFMANILYKIDVDAVRPIDEMTFLADTPLLFLHGEDDDLIPPFHTEVLLKKVNNGQRVLFPDTKHVETFIQHPDLYTKTVGDFFSTNLK